MSYYAVSIVAGITAGVIFFVAIFFYEVSENNFFYNLLISFFIGVSIHNMVFIGLELYKIIPSSFMNLDTLNFIASRSDSQIMLLTILVSGTTLIIGGKLIKNSYVEDKVSYSDLSLSRHMDLEDISLMNITQHGFYLFSITLLWNSRHHGQNMNFVGWLTFALTFIVDDWTVINKTVIALRGRLLPYHLKRFAFFNLIIFVLSCFILINSPRNLWLFFDYVMLVACFLTTTYYQLRASNFLRPD